MGKFVCKFNDYNKRGRWGGRICKSKVRGVIKNCKANNLEWDIIKFIDYTKLNMRQEKNQSGVIYMAMKIGDDYDKLEEKYNELSDVYSAVEEKNASLQNEVESLKKRLRLANVRNFNSQFENQNNTIIPNKVI